MYFRVLSRHAALVVCAAAGLIAAPKPVDFDREVRPILSDNCFTCHGPDAEHRQAGLRFDTRDGAFARKGVIVPGDAAKSRIIRRLTAEQPAVRMPPPAANRTLTPAQIATIRRWIDEGAKWEQHWAYAPPKRPELPAASNEGWVRNAIDRFILARLDKEGLKPSPEADRARLIRRVTFDLTGLPPTPAETAAFLADKSGDAYEKVVDRLLASRHYGERMAMEWLDLARYSDTHGYHIDSHRDMWHWRDWVIDAYNRNMPYNEFTIEQLAGDMLPGASVSQRVATGFNRNHMINFEGGAIPEEYLVEYVRDRVDTTATVFMGSTLGCAKCHDHKYDPFKQREYYQFFAFFNNINEQGLDGKTGNAKPYLQLPTDDQRYEQARLECAIRDAGEELRPQAVKPLLAAWEQSKPATLRAATREGLVAHYEFDGSLADLSGHYRSGRMVRGDVGYEDGESGRSVSFGGEAEADFGRLPELENGGAFTVSAWLRSGGVKEVSAIQKLDAANGRRGWEMGFDESIPIGDLRRGSHFYARLIHTWPDKLVEVRTRERIPLGEWKHYAIVFDGKSAALYIDGKRCDDVDVVKNSLDGPVANTAHVTVGDAALGKPYRGRIDDLRLYSRALPPAEIETLAVDYPLGATLAELPPNRSEAKQERVEAYFLEHDAPAPMRREYAELTASEKALKTLNKEIPTTMVMEETKKHRDAFILGRGDYATHLDKVTADVPSVFPPLPKGAPHTRLTLARWLVSPEHPLTARVAVNRYWQMYFGNGIVKTSEDFGSQGEAPTHPELLDWLATEFVRTGWDVKAMQRLIVTSATYRQASRVTPELLEKDPENRLLARGPRFRLPAEMVRDNALAASGLLDGRIGGRSVFPYQPKGLWEELAFGDVYSAQTYVQSTGRDLYRRSMYTFWKRTVPPPSLSTFDAPDREKCTARRPLTNTPLQALVLMNDPTYVEASRALAQRILMERGVKPDRGIELAYRLAMGRAPAKKETAVLRTLLAKQTAEYRRDPEKARELLAVGDSKPDARVKPEELAAWTTVASVIFNLDETITKE